MSNERIDLTKFDDTMFYDIEDVRDLIAELKRCYEKIDKMDEAILSARELLMSSRYSKSRYVVKELRKASE